MIFGRVLGLRELCGAALSSASIFFFFFKPVDRGHQFKTSTEVLN